MKTTLLLSLAALTGGTTETSTATPTRDISSEICRKTDKDGNPCKGKVTRGSASTSGITYSCSNGHTFTVPPKVRVN
jgi:hypothetical protein